MSVTLNKLNISTLSTSVTKSGTDKCPLRRDAMVKNITILNIARVALCSRQCHQLLWLTLRGDLCAVVYHSSRRDHLLTSVIPGGWFNSML